MRTARSLTSGENLFDFLFMAQSSQSVEPPQNPGRFMIEMRRQTTTWLGLRMSYIAATWRLDMSASVGGQTPPSGMKSAIK
jgi:hypothetical protein